MASLHTSGLLGSKAMNPFMRHVTLAVIAGLVGVSVMYGQGRGASGKRQLSRSSPDAIGAGTPLGRRSFATSLNNSAYGYTPPLTADQYS
jgi:hypothetical protein